MFKIINAETNELIGLADNPKYIIEDSNSGIRYLADKDTANGVIVGDYVYNVNNSEIRNAVGDAIIEEVENGEYLFNNIQDTKQNQKDITTAEQMILTQDNSISIIEEALMELGNT